MASETFAERATEIANEASELAKEVASLAVEASRLSAEAAGQSGDSTLVVGLTVFVLAVFVGYHVVWRVTPALHSPLMAVTNAISSVIIVGALIAAGPAGFGFSEVMGFLAVILASVNIFGGFIVTQRMLSMFKKKK
ncbi:NAD(P) transhydrogenase subunit alpha [Pelagibius litoralis]|uniref:proton-translocating NAD(P)(+) transhydrogenase n=1 Tax=Pelagibius litoralis TaxID=374515 RepID=A0A967CCM0_9PROT|nr:NAD(P) transhydrogenase subunit alpha [Pelagibius litoralis]NIA69149.1 NAD(P) transhydrogenase subunit alpha [Pelagibius litoralis]